MRKKLLSFLVASFAVFPLTLSAREKLCDTYFVNGVVEVESFYPFGELGLYEPGSVPRAELILKNISGRELDAEFMVEVKDYFGKPAGKTISAVRKIAAGQKASVDFTFPGIQANGSFIASAEIRADGKKIAVSQTNFCIIPPFQGERDPFFAFDKGGLEPAFLNAGKIMGIGTLGLYGDWRSEKPDRNPERDAMKQAERWKPFLDSDFKVCVYAVPHLKGEKSKLEEARRARNLPARSDADYEYCSRYFETLARTLKSRCRLYILQEEFDATILGLLPQSHTETLSNFVLVGKNVYAGIKKGNPDSRLAVLGICMSDYYHSTPPFRLSRLVLHDLGHSFDSICIDAYTGNYNAVRGPLGPPERDFRKVLLDTAELSTSYNRPYLVFNAERCYGVNYFDAFDSKDSRDMADYTARSLIIAKSAPCPLFSIHLVRHWNVWQLNQMKIRPEKPFADWGLWKHVPDIRGRDARIPRPVVAAIATTARELAFAENPREVIVDKTVYSYLFQGGGAHSGDLVATLWTTGNEPLPVKLNFPVEARITDLMGNRFHVRAGLQPLVLTGSPFFIRMKCSADAAAKMVSGADFQRKKVFEGFGRRKNLDTLTIHLNNQGAFPLNCTIELDGKSIGKAEIPAFKTARIPVLAGKDRTAAETAEVHVKGESAAYSIPLDFNYTPVKKMTGLFQPAGRIDPYLNWTKWSLKAPENVYPVNATMPERGFFRYSGGDPSAEVYLAWDEKALYLAAEMKDKVHIQRQTGWNVWQDDCLQFAVNTENDASGFQFVQKALRGRVYNFALSLTKNGTEFYRFDGGKKGPGQLRFPARVTRLDGSTVYEAAIPWEEFEGNFQPVPGAALGFNAVLFNVDSAEHSRAPYHFRLAPGLADGQDFTKFKTILLEGNETR